MISLVMGIPVIYRSNGYGICYGKTGSSILSVRIRTVDRTDQSGRATSRIHGSAMVRRRLSALSGSEDHLHRAFHAARSEDLAWCTLTTGAEAAASRGTIGGRRLCLSDQKRFAVSHRGFKLRKLPDIRRNKYQYKKAAI